MPKYNVTIRHWEEVTITVDATDEDDATEKAVKLFPANGPWDDEDYDAEYIEELNEETSE